MDAQRRRIQDDLRGRLQGDVYCDPVFVQMYSLDASIYSITPLGVVRPRNVSDVVATVQYAQENKLTVHARGAGTGLAGGCLGPGLIVDFSCYMRRILEIKDDQVRVQAGAFLQKLNRKLAPLGRRFGPDPSTLEISTVGGTIAVNGSGSHWPRYGAPSGCVVGLQVVLANGDIWECRTHSGEMQAQDGVADPVDGMPMIQAELNRIVQRYADTIRRAEPQTAVNSSGYDLFHAVRRGSVDPTRLFVGSEGTLGLITEATLRTFPVPRHTGVMLLFFDRLEKAARTALELIPFRPSACDLMDRRLLRMARECDVRYDVVIPPEAEAMLLVDLEDDSAAAVRDRLRQVANQICHRRKLAFDVRTALDVSDVALFWRLTQSVVPTLYRIAGEIRPVPFVEDIAVPPHVLPDFLITAQNILKRHQITASFFAHATHGQLHLRPLLDLSLPEAVTRLHHLARDLYQEVAKVRGTLSGEHGDGLSRSWYLREQFPEYFRVLQAVKNVLDPHKLLNPGKVADEVPASPSAFLRRNRLLTVPAIPLESEGPPSSEANGATAPWQFSMDRQQLLQIVSTCNGCGRCRTTSELERMCPIFRIYPAEEASPRAKATILRGLFDGTIDQAALAGDQLKLVADLCVNCQQCRSECPAGVDIPRLVLECKAQHVAAHGLTFFDWILGRLDLLAAWCAPVAPFINLLLRSRRARWMIERLLGLSRRRKLPRMRSQSFLQRAAKRQWTRHTRSSGPKVAYFADVYANWFDPELAESLIEVLHHNGISVYVPPRQMQSGMALIASGAIAAARKLAQQNISLLADLIRQGYTIVATEPSAVLCLTQEYPRILPGPDTTLVAENTMEACAYLWQLHQQGQLELDFSPLSLVVGYHQPCHLRALGKGTTGLNLLKLIPGITVRHLDFGCSGMAGVWGLKSKHFRDSLRAGRRLIHALREGLLDIGATECSTCRLQMLQGSPRPTVHPLKFLSLAYRLTPEVESELTTSHRELIIQ